MVAVKTDLYIALTNAGVPQETAGKLAAADAKLDVEAALIATLKTISDLKKWRDNLEDGLRGLEDGLRANVAKDDAATTIDGDREKTKVLMIRADRGDDPGQRRYLVVSLANSVEYHPGDHLTPEEVRALCDAPGWQVHISPELRPLPPL